MVRYSALLPCLPSCVALGTLSRSVPCKHLSLLPPSGGSSGLSLMFLLCPAPRAWPLSSACFYLPSGRFLFRPVFRALLCPCPGAWPLSSACFYLPYSPRSAFSLRRNAFSIFSAAMRFYALFPAIGRFHSSQISLACPPPLSAAGSCHRPSGYPTPCTAAFPSLCPRRPPPALRFVLPFVPGQSVLRSPACSACPFPGPARCHADANSASTAKNSSASLNPYRYLLLVRLFVCVVGGKYHGVSAFSTNKRPVCRWLYRRNRL